MYDFMFAPGQTRTCELAHHAAVQYHHPKVASGQHSAAGRRHGTHRSRLPPGRGGYRSEHVGAHVGALGEVQDSGRRPAYFSCFIPGPDAPPFGLDLPRPRNWYTRLISRSVWTATAPFRSAFPPCRQRDTPPLRPAALRMPVSNLPVRCPFIWCWALPSSITSGRICLRRFTMWAPAFGTSRATRRLPIGWNNCPRTNPGCMPSEGTVHVLSPFVLTAAAQGLANLAHASDPDNGRQSGTVRLRLRSHRPQCARRSLGLSHGTPSPSFSYDYYRGFGHGPVHVEGRRPADHCTHGVGQAGYCAPRSRNASRHPSRSRTNARPSASVQPWNRCSVRLRTVRTHSAWLLLAATRAALKPPRPCSKNSPRSEFRHKSTYFLVPPSSPSGGHSEGEMVRLNRLVISR